MTRGDVQPRTGASMIDHKTRASPAIDSTAPVKSGRSAAGFFEFGTSGMAHSRPARGNRHVDQEHRSPPEMGEQQAADDRAERKPHPAGPGPEADRPLPLAWHRGTRR